MEGGPQAAPPLGAQDGAPRVRKRVVPCVTGPPGSSIPSFRRQRLDSPCAASASPRPAALELPRPVVRLRAADADSDAAELTFQFSSTPACEVRRAASRRDLQRLLEQEAARADASIDGWLRLPQTKWMRQMVEELPPPMRARVFARRRRLEQTAVPESDFMGRWVEASDFASFVLGLWLDGRSLEEVLARSEALGQMGADAVPGCILEGELVQAITKAEDIRFAELLPMIEVLSRKESTVSVYKVRRHNCFEQEQRLRHPVHKLAPGEGVGSLNTTWTYEEDRRSGAELLDEFHDDVLDVLVGCDSVRLNPRMYLIWKFQHYVTSYHQDTHVPPHCTLYNQVSGVSVFHFLPVLVGLYVTHVGRRDPDKLRAVLAELDRRGVGSLATLGPGQVALILPFGAHGVWVPAEALNPSLPSFEVSLIRAAELFVQPVERKCRELLQGPRWNHVLEPTKEELVQLKSFVEAQEQLCAQMGLSRGDWSWFSKKTWQLWCDEEEEALAAEEGAGRGEEADEDGEEEAAEAEDNYAEAEDSEDDASDYGTSEEAT